jgi:hypothetical protein
MSCRGKIRLFFIITNLLRGDVAEIRVPAFAPPINFFYYNTGQTLEQQGKIQYNHPAAIPYGREKETGRFGCGTSAVFRKIAG